MRRQQKNAASRRGQPAWKPSQDEISREAFKIFQARHGAPGDPVADWFEAERTVMARGPGKAPRAAEAEAAAGRNGRRGRTSARRRK